MRNVLSSNDEAVRGTTRTMGKIQSALGFHYPQVVIPLVNAAGATIDILMYEWKWYGHESAGGVQKLNLAYVAAARRGVKVRVLMNIESMGHAITRINSRTKSFLERYGIEVKWGQVGIVTHAKMVIIDDKVLVLGSHNYTKSAFSRNQEASIVVNGRDEIVDYRKYFDDLWAQFS